MHVFYSILSFWGLVLLHSMKMLVGGQSKIKTNPPLLHIVKKQCHVDPWTDGYMDRSRAASGTEARPGPRPRLVGLPKIQ